MQAEIISLLQSLIRIPSFSREEQGTADLIESFLTGKGIRTYRAGNNVFAFHESTDPTRPTLILNSHHDTVRPNPGYTRDPFMPTIEGDHLYGLGSNDAGGSLVALIGAFLHMQHQPDLPFHVLLAATAEEEISGTNGIEALLRDVQFQALTKGGIWAAIVGEPTQMQMAVSEKGLMVLDAVASGRAGHAAREEGLNALYMAMDDIAWIRQYRFPKVSPTLGEMKMTVTSIHTENKAHNIVPATCQFVVDVRLTDVYTHEEVLNILQSNLQSELTPRSMRMRSTHIPATHPLVLAGARMGKRSYGSPTSSDKALMPFPALKCGPGDSARSHTADEFILVSECLTGMHDYIQIIEGAAQLLHQSDAPQVKQQNTHS
jgi:acetylornithine deacetylase/succinyl-diaminopimelate desuccinylase-like protein